jgi:hypothetical protein
MGAKQDQTSWADIKSGSSVSGTSSTWWCDLSSKGFGQSHHMVCRPHDLSFGLALPVD